MQNAVAKVFQGQNSMTLLQFRSLPKSPIPFRMKMLVINEVTEVGNIAKLFLRQSIVIFTIFK